MGKIKLFKYCKNILILIFIYFFIINRVFAIPPPDFIVQIVSQSGIYISLFIAIVSTFLATSFIYFKSFYKKHKKIIYIFLLLIFIILVYLLKIEYEKRVLLAKNITINMWLNYEDVENYNKYKDLSFDEKVDILLKIFENDLLNWFFDNNIPSNKVYSINNDELNEILKSKDENYVLLDAREDLEYEIGHIPGSVHYRTSDLKLMEKWKELLPNKKYVVICWSGYRGYVTSKYLAYKGLDAVYLEGGVEKWIEEKNLFNGTTELEDIFKDYNYNNYLSDLEFIKEIDKGVEIVDVRDNTKLNQKDILPFANNINISFMSSEVIYTKLAKYKKDDRVIVICDDYYNCFDGEMISIELERKGIDLIGIYIKRGIIN